MKRALAACLWLLAAPAQAEPSVWAKARNPETAARARAAADADELIASYQQIRRGPSRVAQVLVLRDARDRLEAVDAEHAADPSLRHLLAQTYYGLYDLERTPELLERATTLFASVARSDAPTTTRADALNDLAICYARAEDHEREIRAYDEALALEPHAETRATLLANQAEGLMASGDLTRAIRGYRASLAITPGYAMHVYAPTTHWGLGVALDRSGDLEGALEQIRAARSYDPSDVRLSSPTWFYVPPYDEHWYAALGHWTRARDATEQPQKVEAYDEALAALSRYLDRAAPDDPWIARASERQRECERERRRAASKPPK
jgi:tetratricopeptide (TPR) repeat protein